MIMTPDDPSQPLPVEPGETVVPRREAPRRAELAARIETIQAVLVMAAGQADRLLSCTRQLQSAFHDMAERLQSAPHPEAVLSLLDQLHSLQNELDWLATKQSVSLASFGQDKAPNNIDVSTLQTRLSVDQAELLTLKSEAEQALTIAGQVATTCDHLGTWTSQMAAISSIKERSEALLAKARSLLG